MLARSFFFCIVDTLCMNSHFLVRSQDVQMGVGPDDVLQVGL